MTKTEFFNYLSKRIHKHCHLCREAMDDIVEEISNLESEEELKLVIRKDGIYYIHIDILKE